MEQPGHLSSGEGITALALCLNRAVKEQDKVPRKRLSVTHLAHLSLNGCSPFLL